MNDDRPMYKTNEPTKRAHVDALRRDFDALIRLTVQTRDEGVEVPAEVLANALCLVVDRIITALEEAS
jgi:hypothetical protein